MYSSSAKNLLVLLYNDDMTQSSSGIDNHSQHILFIVKRVLYILGRSGKLLDNFKHVDCSLL